MVVPTFNPEVFDVRLERGRLQSDAAERQKKKSEEEDLAAVPLNEAPHLEQVHLHVPSNPERPDVASRFTLQNDTETVEVWKASSST